MRTPVSNEFFFFSSRRRHTRSDRDWSSDVCSSDLLLVLAVPHAHASISSSLAVVIFSQPSVVTARSEEHTSELQSRSDLVCRLLLEKKKMSIPLLLSAVDASCTTTRSLDDLTATLA